MNTAFRLGRIAGIAVDVHATFALLLVWVALAGLLQGGDLAVMFGELLFVGLLFGCVLLHELGHALMARQFGVGTRVITLLPIGGVAQLSGSPARPSHEILVALAGPAVNMALATVLLPLMLAFSGPEVMTTGYGLLARLLWANVGLALFNLIPAFPMDGGRVLRAGLATQLGARSASHAAASVGQVVAVIMGLVGLFGHPMLVLIALFVWSHAAQEKEAVHMARPAQAYFEEQAPRVLYVRRVARRAPREPDPFERWSN